MEEKERELRDYINVIWKRKKNIFIIFFVAVFTATIISFITPKMYEVSTIIKIGGIIQPLSVTSGIAQSLVSKEEAIIKLKTKSLLNPVIQKLNLNIDVPELKNIIKVEDIKNTDFLKIKIQHTNPDLAVTICNAIANSFVLKEKEIYDKNLTLLNKQVEILGKRNESIEKEMEKLNQVILSQTTNQDFLLIQNTLSNYEIAFSRLNETFYLLNKELMNSPQFEIWEPAVIPQYPIKPNKVLNISISGLVALFLGILIAFSQEYFSKTE